MAFLASPSRRRLARDQGFKRARLSRSGRRTGRGVNRCCGPSTSVNRAGHVTGSFARLWGTYGVIIGVALNVLVFFVLAEAVPKTYAVLYPQKAALFTARPVSALVAFPPLRLISRWLIKLTNVIVRGKGLQQGPFVTESELLGIVETAADDGVVEARGTTTDREHHRIRRHRGSAGDGAPVPHRHTRRFVDGDSSARSGARIRIQPAAAARSGATTTWSGWPTSRSERCRAQVRG